MGGTAMKKICRYVLASVLSAGFALPAMADEIKVGLLQDFTAVYTFVTGQYNQGQRDYLTLVNEEGGLNGHNFSAIVRDTGNQPQRGIEAYNRAREEGAVLFDMLSTPVSAALIDSVARDEVVLITPAHGRGDASDGRVFPYVFPMFATYWSQAASIIKHIKDNDGGLSGKKIALVHIDSPFGREPITVLSTLAKNENFEFRNFPYTSPGNEQSSAWSEVRRFRPDHVLIWGAGGGQAVSVRSAIQNGIRPEQIYSVIWLAETDATNVGPAIKGVKRFEASAAGLDFPIIQRISDKVIAPGKGAGETANVGTSYYNLGVATMAVAVEAARLALEDGGPLTGPALKAGFERIAGYDAEGLLPALTITPEDHQGGGAGRISQWDGSAWVPVSEWAPAYQDVVRAEIESSAAKYRGN
jgi:branched-chain amino acid transport system substrate-binding protein